MKLFGLLFIIPVLSFYISRVIIMTEQPWPVIISPCKLSQIFMCFGFDDCLEVLMSGRSTINNARKQYISILVSDPRFTGRLEMLCRKFLQ